MVIGGYERGFVLREEGWNLFFQEVLASRLYGPAPRRWLRFLFEAPGFARLGNSGQAAVGRLGRIPLQLTWLVVAEVLRRRGLPPTD